MSFIKNLFLGLIRSTVNQVGRDAGKIISNKTFGDKHSAPIRVVRNGSNASKSNENDVYSPNVELLPSGCLSYILYFILLPSPLLGPLFWLYKGFKNLTKDSYTPIFPGELQETITSEKLTNSQKQLFTFKGVILIIIGSLVLYYQVPLILEHYNNEKSSVAFRTSTIKYNNTIIRAQSNTESEIMIYTNQNDTVVLDLTDSISDEIKGVKNYWYKVQKPTQGWVWGELIN